MKSFVLFIILSLFCGCTTALYRAEFKSRDKNPINSERLSSFFIYNGFEKRPWPSDEMFGPATKKGVSQLVISYWFKHFDRSAMGDKTGFIQAWEVIEAKKQVVYIVGSQGRYGEALDVTNNLKMALTKLHPTIEIVLSKSGFVDAR